MNVPSWASHLFSTQDRKAIAQAVAQAESKTQGEIVTMVVRRSSAIHHLPLSLFALLMLLSFCCYFGMEHIWAKPLSGWICAVWPFALWFISVGLCRFPAIQRLLLPKTDRDAQVMTRARLEFYESIFGATKERTGILIFLSVMERRCVILADKKISDSYPQETWKDLIQIIIGGIKSGRPAEALIRAIDQCGKILASHIPAEEENPNELSDNLVIKE